MTCNSYYESRDAWLFNRRSTIFGMVIVFLVFPFLAWSQQSLNQIKKEADHYFEQSVFDEALLLYEKYLSFKSNNSTVLLNGSICAFAIHDVGKADQLIHDLLEIDKSPEPDVYYQAGLISHHLSRFKLAASYYKMFLKESKLNDEKRPLVVEQIKRCGSGIKFSSIDNGIYIERLASPVNSNANEIIPIYSPNLSYRIYFSSDRYFQRTADSTVSEVFRKGTYNMYFAEIIEGEWTNVSELNSDLNTQKNEILSDFNKDGSVIYFGQENSRSGKFLMDTFSNNEKPSNPVLFSKNFHMDRGDRDLYFFSDSILLFSSNSRKGYGGYDLFICRKKNGKWSRPKNLGGKINSSFDEISPFITNDGRTLYFSSNNQNSMGGFDVFASRFDDKLIDWIKPNNIGSPLNSPGNDAYFKLDKNGFSGVFSSDRKSGYGGYDLYNIYFKDPIRAQTSFSNPLIFDDVISEKAEIIENRSGFETPKFVESKIKQVEISSIFYEREGHAINPRNKIYIDKLANTMLQYPGCRLLISVFSDYEGPKHLDLFFSFKNGEQIKEYLVKKGLKKELIEVRASGNNYIDPGMDLNKAQRDAINRRIDFTILNYEQYPVSFNYNLRNSGRRDLSRRYTNYKENVRGLTYRIQIAAVNQMYNNIILDEYGDPAIEQNPGFNGFKYTLGLYKTYGNAVKLKLQLQSSGHPDVFIVPYIDGLRISGEELNKHLNEHQDLYDYLNANR